MLTFSSHGKCTQISISTNLSRNSGVRRQMSPCFCPPQLANKSFLFCDATFITRLFLTCDRTCLMFAYPQVIFFLFHVLTFARFLESISKSVTAPNCCLEMHDCVCLFCHFWPGVSINQLHVDMQKRNRTFFVRFPHTFRNIFLG